MFVKRHSSHVRRRPKRERVLSSLKRDCPFVSGVITRKLKDSGDHGDYGWHCNHNSCNHVEQGNARQRERHSKHDGGPDISVLTCQRHFASRIHRLSSLRCAKSNLPLSVGSVSEDFGLTLRTISPGTAPASKLIC